MTKSLKNGGASRSAGVRSSTGANRSTGDRAGAGVPKPAAKAPKQGAKAPNLKNLRLYPGVITGGAPEALKKHGFKLDSVKTRAGGKAYVGTDRGGKSSLFVDRAMKSYRSIAQRLGLKTKGRDIDHVQARATTKNTPTFLSRMQSIGKVPNRSAANKEKTAPARLVKGLAVANSPTIRKINGHNQEKPLAKKPARADMREIFNGYAGNAEKNLAKNGAVKTTGKDRPVAKNKFRKF